MGLLKDVNEVLHKVSVSQMCLSDLIHDGLACGDPMDKYEKKYEFMREVEEELRALRDKCQKFAEENEQES